MPQVFSSFSVYICIKPNINIDFIYIFFELETIITVDQTHEKATSESITPLYFNFVIAIFAVHDHSEIHSFSTFAF